MLDLDPKSIGFTWPFPTTAFPNPAGMTVVSAYLILAYLTTKYSYLAWKVLLISLAFTPKTCQYFTVTLSLWLSALQRSRKITWIQFVINMDHEIASISIAAEKSVKLTYMPWSYYAKGKIINFSIKEQHFIMVTPKVNEIICSQTPYECMKANSDTERQLLLIARSFSS